jgi:hypothetical protein
MTLADLIMLDAILGYRVVGKHEVATMQTFVNKFIDPKAVICNYCSAQIKYYHKRIEDWAGANSGLIEETRNPKPLEEPKKRGRKPKTEE